MEQEIPFLAKVLNGFLSVMVAILIGVLSTIVIAFILSAFRFF